jgi:ABC-2 type transport system ATP-binding protein
MSSTPAIDVRDLRRSYGEIEAVRGVSFSVAPGEIFCLLGPNGAGKTTTTEILEGYRDRSGGEVSVLGFDPAGGDRELRDRMGIVLQETGVQPMLTVRELLEMYGGWYTRRRPTAELLRLVGLEEKADMRAQQLSGGQRRRLDLALGLVGDPQLLFLDEPTTGFDPEARRRSWGIIRSLADQGTTIFLTTHFMDEAQQLADRVAVMRAGEIVALGRPDELGGRETAPTEITFVLPAGVTATDVPRAGDGTTLKTDAEDRVTVTATAGLEAVNAITAWALDHGHDLRGFSVARPTLEDIYLELTATATQQQEA